MQGWPHSDRGVPQSAGSADGQRGSRQTSGEGAFSAIPIRALHTSPFGQTVCGLVESQTVTHEQFDPQPLSG
jgi:hypothetical protein